MCKFCFTLFADGNWTRWSPWNACNRRCGGGIQTRSRTCTNPQPSNGGAYCDGKSLERRPCNSQECAGMSSQVSYSFNPIANMFYLPFWLQCISFWCQILICWYKSRPFPRYRHEELFYQRGWLQILTFISLSTGLHAFLMLLVRRIRGITYQDNFALVTE